MSGFEIVGVVFGALPLMISALEHYKSGRSALSSIVHYQGQLNRLLDRLKDQYRALYFDILDLLRSAEIEEVEDRTDVSPEDCLVILRNTKNGYRLQQYLGIHHGDFIKVLQRYEECLKEIARKLRHIKRLPNTSKDDLASLVNANPVSEGRFIFTESISFSLEKGKLIALVEELGEDKLGLKTIIKGMKTEKEHFLKHPSNSSRRLCKILGQVAASAKALHTAICRSCTLTCQSSRTVFLELHHRTPPTGPGKATNQFTRSLAFGLVLELESHLREACVEVDSDCSPQTVAVFNTSRHVSFEDHNPLPSITLSREIRLLQVAVKVPCICDLTSEIQIRDHIINLKLNGETLNLIGKPSQIQRKLSVPMTLEAVLRQGATDKKLRMRPKQRIILALNVASSIIQLRDTCWTSLALSSKVIKCMVGANGANPKVSITAFIEQVSEPGRAAPSPGCGPKVALLELAILLLELCNHMTLDMWAAEANFGETKTTSERLAAATDWLDNTDDFPEHYLDAIEQCLSLYVQRSREWDDDRFLKMYCENVIKPLRESSEIYPDR